jgi:hypothetical protein
LSLVLTSRFCRSKRRDANIALGFVVSSHKSAQKSALSRISLRKNGHLGSLFDAQEEILGVPIPTRGGGAFYTRKLRFSSRILFEQKERHGGNEKLGNRTLILPPVARAHSYHVAVIHNFVDSK